jgi:hypothetical protein
VTRRVQSESGQAVVVMLLFLVTLLGGVALALDVGSWYREHRQAQQTADAAALSGAQVLPGDPTQALSLAQSYADQNGGGINPSGGIALQGDFTPNDTLTVKVTRTAPGFFSKLFGIDSVNVHATATARSAVPIDVRWAAPIVVNKAHPDLSGPGCPCFNQETTIPLGKNGAPGSFGLIDLEKYAPDSSGACTGSSGGGNAGASTLGDWIQSGFSAYLNIGCYSSDPGAKFSSSNIGGAMTARIGTDLLFPVYDALTGTGANAQYHIIGWAAFHVDGFTAHGNSGSVTGYFTQVIWDGIQSTTAPTGNDFGVYTIALIN